MWSNKSRQRISVVFKCFFCPRLERAQTSSGWSPVTAVPSGLDYHDDDVWTYVPLRP
jgi:hypothetical protein